MATIRRMRKRDHPQLLGIFLEEWSNPPYRESWNPKDAEGRLRELHSDPGFCLVAEESGRLVGFAFANRFTWHDGEHLMVNEFVVSGPHQARGIGTEMMEALLEGCEREGLRGVFLFAHSASLAMRFYRKHGFEATPWTMLYRALGADNP